MTKTNPLTLGGEGDHVADLHLFPGDHDTINKQLNELSFLLGGGLVPALAQESLLFS
ncbi:hypothetical protein KSD_17270 [Ktedonobacter sp. SOSP1-85]|uniref:hypothetical protein n=1 Tax=Ktedonobacter sp. SOSP1-85 TaxID=2778367 RepID=UPI00191624E0|nr:hypothetical protein [Ktedonobacter sp. SOSP1-85]GHO73956.1 hypothetical protein KSD_17270 [Ktedonobacter sp. SOSP1-85]